jgi:hypothetical protein
MKTSDSVLYELENPLGAPYKFEGFTTPEEAIAEMSASLDLKNIQVQDGVGVLREGENSHGTWGPALAKAQYLLEIFALIDGCRQTWARRYACMMCRASRIY